MKEKFYFILCLVFVLLFIGCSQDDISDDTLFINQEETENPIAEYDRAGAVLVNSPGEEYINGYLESVQDEHNRYVLW